MKKTIAIIGFIIVLCLIIYDFYKILYKPFAFTPSIIVLMIIYLGLDIKYIFKHDRVGIIIFSILSIIYICMSVIGIMKTL